MRALFSWLSGPSRKALQRANETLRREVAAHQETVRELETIRADLARRLKEQTEDLRVLSTRFETAIGGSAISVSEQDETLHYTWIYNPPLGLLASQFIGRTEQDLMDREAADHIQQAKRAALASGEPQRDEVRLSIGGRTAWLGYTVTPTRLRDGRRGVVASSTNITAIKTQQAHLQTVMQELNHRAKNLLTIVQSIARQSATGLDLPESYLTRLNDRLRALAQAHDVLVQQNWRGADLRSVIEAQLSHQLDGAASRIRLNGGPIELPPEAAHYVGLALHELGTNAAKYGALSDPQGRVEVSWGVNSGEESGPKLHLAWREFDGPRVEPAGRHGFGRTILEVLTPKAMGGRSELSFAEDGVRWTLTAPLPGAG